MSVCGNICRQLSRALLFGLGENALFELGDASFDDKEIVLALSGRETQVKRAEIYQKFKEASDNDNAKNEIKLPKQSREEYLTKWKHINSFLKDETLDLLERAGAVTPKPVRVRASRPKWGKEGFLDAGEATFGG